MAVFELIADLALIFGKETYCKHLQSIFMSYLTNTAASVRQMGIAKSRELASKFGAQWVLDEYVPVVNNHYNVDKKGYNYRICCLYSLSEVLPHVPKDQITTLVIPVLVKGMKDDIPNVRFCVSKIIIKQKQYIDTQQFNNVLQGPLKEMVADTDKDVSYFAGQALSSAV
jgi:serine/threonine-protein phosphatase 2A regulatory subunit A